MTRIDGYDKWKTTPPEEPEPDPPEEPKVTHEEYVKAGGMICPWCKSEDLDWGLMEAEIRGATQEVTCNECGKEWLDVHELKAFSEVTL